MNHFSNEFSYQSLNYIPYVYKYRYYKLNNALQYKSFDFKFSCQSPKELRNSDVYKIIKKHKLEKYFKIICKHYYFYKFGPSLKGVCTRRIKQLKKNYNSKKPKKRCCDKLILMTQEQWKLPAHKRWSFNKYLLKPSFFCNFF